MISLEKNRYLFAPPFCESVETYILPVPKFKFETTNEVMKRAAKYKKIILASLVLLSSINYSILIEKGN